MKQSGTLVAGATAVVVGVFGARAALDAAQQQPVQAPLFEVDMLWPKPMPNHWLLGSTVGLAVDSRDHVFVVHLGPSSFNLRTEIGGYSGSTAASECCAPAPQVLEYNPAGELVGHWGGPGEGYAWPSSNHGLAIDPAGNIWIGGSGGRDTHILKFARDGRFIAQFGTAAPPAAPAPAAAADTAYQGVSRGAAGRGGDSAAAGRGGRAGGGRGGGRGGGAQGPPPLAPNSLSTETFGGPADVSFDASANEAFVADGYRNRRVAVVDIRTGAIKRFWGGFGNRPADAGATPMTQFGTPVTCAELSRDGFVYVCDRSNNRIQVFSKNGQFVGERVVAAATKGEGSVWDIAFSRDAEQRYLYIADGTNSKVRVLERRSLVELTTFGEGGRQPGQFYGLHSIATDSRGNVYTVETYQGKRLQKFTFKGVGPVSARTTGTVWPGRGQ
jgi:DNA-binding beta-propeller fold protein YncE